MYLADWDVDATDCHELAGVPVDRFRVFVGDGDFYGTNPDSGGYALRECFRGSVQSA